MTTKPSHTAPRAAYHAEKEKTARQRIRNNMVGGVLMITLGPVGPLLIHQSMDRLSDARRGFNSAVDGDMHYDSVRQDVLFAAAGSGYRPSLMPFANEGPSGAPPEMLKELSARIVTDKGLSERDVDSLLDVFPDTQERPLLNLAIDSLMMGQGRLQRCRNSVPGDEQSELRAQEIASCMVRARAKMETFSLAALFAVPAAIGALALRAHGKRRDELEAVLEEEAQSRKGAGPKP